LLLNVSQGFYFHYTWKELGNGNFIGDLETGTFTTNSEGNWPRIC